MSSRFGLRVGRAIVDTTTGALLGEAHDLVLDTADPRPGAHAD
jgi:hypothetical protein